MEFKNPYWTNVDKIQMLQRWILVHSAIYYEYNSSIVSDSIYDKNTAQLVSLMSKYPKSAKMSKYSYCFKGFDGSTGFHLFGLLKRQDKRQIARDVDHVLSLRRIKT